MPRRRGGWNANENGDVGFEVVIYFDVVALLYGMLWVTVTWRVCPLWLFCLLYRAGTRLGIDSNSLFIRSEFRCKLTSGRGTVRGSLRSTRAITGGGSIFVGFTDAGNSLPIKRSCFFTGGVGREFLRSRLRSGCFNQLVFSCTADTITDGIVRAGF